MEDATHIHSHPLFLRTGGFLQEIRPGSATILPPDHASITAVRLPNIVRPGLGGYSSSRNYWLVDLLLRSGDAYRAGGSNNSGLQTTDRHHGRGMARQAGALY